MAKRWHSGANRIFAGGGGGKKSFAVETGTPSSGIGAQLMARAEFNPQFEADKAATDVQAKGDRAIGAENRRLTARGISPGSGRARAINRNAQVALAAAKAGAANKGRRSAVEDNWKRVSTAAGFVRSDQNRLDKLKQLQFSAQSSGSPGINVRAGGRTQSQRMKSQGITPASTAIQGGRRLESSLTRMGGPSLYRKTGTNPRTGGTSRGQYASKKLQRIQPKTTQPVNVSMARVTSPFE